MEINFNRNGGGLDVWKLGGQEAGGQAGRVQNLQPGRPLTVQTSAAAPEDIAAAGIPEAALRRDDALGRLVGMAFNLPPPPLPMLE